MSMKITYWVSVIILILSILFACWNFGINAANSENFGFEGRNNSENNPPELSNPKMTPTNGDVDTEFSFSVHYCDSDFTEPDFIIIMIDNIFYNMNLQPGQIPCNGTYEYKTYLFLGEHTYYFIASDNNQSVRTQNFSTPFINKAEKKAQDQSWEEWGYVIIIILLIAPIIILYFYIHVTNRKRERAREDKSSGSGLDKSKYISLVLTKSGDMKKHKRKMDVTAQPGFEYRCYKCDTVVTPAFSRCPECGEELSF